MPAYTFEAVDANGVTHKGVIDADTARAARGLLRDRQHLGILVAEHELDQPVLVRLEAGRGAEHAAEAFDLVADERVNGAVGEAA